MKNRNKKQSFKSPNGRPPGTEGNLDFGHFCQWNPESKFRLQRIWIQYLESKAVLDYLTWGD